MDLMETKWVYCWSKQNEVIESKTYLQSIGR
jgi:hypothetical protein